MELIRYRAPVTLLLELHAFLQEHRRCGDLDAAVEEVTPGDTNKERAGT